MYTINDAKIILRYLEQILTDIEEHGMSPEYELQMRTGFSVGEMESLLEGEEPEAYKKKIAGLEREQQWYLVEQLCKRAGQVVPDYPGKETADHVAFRLKNMLEVLSPTDENHVLAEKAFRLINQDVSLLRVLSEVRVEPYLMLCNRYCSNVSTAPLVAL